MNMDIDGHDTKIETRDIVEFTAGKSRASGKVIKVEKPFIVLIKVDPWNSELHQFETKEEAGAFIVGGLA